MCSKFTRDRVGLNVVMAVLQERKLMFLDSRTAPRTVGETIARAHHVTASHRDVFIDNDEYPAEVAKSLKQIENVARHAGTTNTNSQPKNKTHNTHKKWLPK